MVKFGTIKFDLHKDVLCVPFLFSGFEFIFDQCRSTGQICLGLIFEVNLIAAVHITN